MLYFCIGGLALAGAVLAPLPARGEERAAGARANVVRSCAAEAGRFCADAGGAPRSGRTVLICLRPFRTSLSLPCRAAVNAALRPAP